MAAGSGQIKRTPALYSLWYGRLFPSHPGGLVASRSVLPQKKTAAIELDGGRPVVI
ncbi:hypothetical protein PHAMO_290018 [Magnetospirillum molischianum DSM 120]|uniref:Uncharacterized protein n=1 Tax=Magnetospirillum molischianum DSM 120 TaxID=1150626 RepID=H8FU06_MAGML|nr:hypothetical protein PHAMO_290018 [Magnetospirillum molischianum DSM 120]